MALTDITKLKAWGNPALDTSRDTELARCITAASDWIAQVAGRVLEAASQAVVLNGDDAHDWSSDGDALDLDPGHSPVAYPTGFTITEDGISLTHTSGYDTSKDVIVLNPNSFKRCVLVRRGSWSPGAGNVAVAYTAGYSSGSIPARVEQLANEVAWILFQSPHWIGKTNISGPSGSVSIDKELTLQSQAVLDELRAGVVR